MIKTVGLFGLLASLILVISATCVAGDDKDEYLNQRLKMVAEQIEARGVSDALVLAAMRQVPRHLFVPAQERSQAYGDHPLPIGYGQTISQPYIVAYMTEVLRLTGQEKVLEIGTGSGYQAAILAETAKEVYSMEIIPPLHAQAKARLASLGFENVSLKAADGYFGWPEEAPFDGIIVTCAAAHIPPPLIRQLKPGGRMVIPVGPSMFIQDLILAQKDKGGRVTTRSLMAVRFVPLVRDK